MGNAPLCISQQAVTGEYVGDQPDYVVVAAQRYHSGSPDDTLTGSMREEGGREKRGGVRWSEDCELWEEERNCDMILGLELFQDSVSFHFMSQLTEASL